MRIVKFYSYDTQPWRYGLVVWQKRCSHTGDSLIKLITRGGSEQVWDLDKIKVEEVLNVDDADLDVIKQMMESNK